MRNYKIKLTPQQIAKLNTLEYEENRRKCFSILSYLVKHVCLNGGAFRKSFNKLHKMYIRHHKTMSLTTMKKIVNRLEELGLIIIDKSDKTNVYRINEKFRDHDNNDPGTTVKTENKTKKVPNSNEPESADNSSNAYDNVNTEIHNSKSNYNTITNIEEKESIFNRLLKAYKGMCGNSILSKSELKKLAKSLLFLRGVHEPHIQQWVLSKIIYSHVNIKSYGAVEYINTIITEKLIDSSNYIYA